MRLPKIFGPVEWVPNSPDMYPNMPWTERHAKYQIWYDYFSGRALDAVIDSGDGKSVPKFPIKINICRQIALTQAYILLGEWDDKVFDWRSINSEGPEDQLEFLRNTSILSSMNSQYVRQAITHSVLGGMVWKIATSPTHLKWVPIAPESFYPVFSTLDEELLELFVTTEISGREAFLRYGYDGDSEFQTYMEHWTRDKFEISVGGKLVREGGTIDGVIPYEYIQRANVTGEPYGISSIEDVIGIQDEWNARLADIGDAVSRETHKDMVISGVANGLKGITRSKGVVDLGVGLGTQPKVHDYSKANVPSGTFEMLDKINDLTMITTGVPPVSFGIDEGSQRSAMTLNFRMWPLVQSGKINRSFVIDGMAKLARKTLILARAAGYVNEEPAHFRPDLPPMLPRDHDAAVNEVVQLSGVDMISDERAMDVLGIPESDRDEEVKRIKALREEARKFNEERLAANSQFGGSGSGNKRPDNVGGSGQKDKRAGKDA